SKPGLQVQEDALLRVRAPKGVALMGVTCVNGAPVPGWVLDQRDPETGDVDMYAPFPRPGAYLLRVVVVRGDPAKGVVDAVAESRMNVKKGKGEQYRMPIIWPAFHEKGCYLHEPVAGKPKAGKIAFKIRVPGAKQVAVGVGKNPVPLTGKD